MDNRTPSERFWAKVDRREDDDCWPWIAGLDKRGYGQFRYRDQTRGAHRFSYEERYGHIPAGLVIDHNCHNLDFTCEGGNDCPHRRCVNPRHLRAVPQSVNLISSRLTVNYASASVTHCPKGHAYEGENLAVYAAGRACRTCKREQSRTTDTNWRNAARRERYAQLRAAGLSVAEAQSASKAKVAMHCGESSDSADLA